MVVDYNKSKSINAGMVVVDVKEERGGGRNGTSFLVVKERRELPVRSLS